jgi:hypothetical protein
MEPARTRAIKERLHSRLKRLAPGGSSSLKALRLMDGEITTEPSKIASDLARHWSQVFPKVELEDDFMEQWLTEAFPEQGRMPLQSAQVWQITRADIASAVSNSQVILCQALTVSRMRHGAGLGI